MLTTSTSGYISTQASKCASGFGGLVVSMLASGTQDRGIKPGQIHNVPSFGGEVKPSVPCRRFAACKRTLQFTWVGIAGQIDRPFIAQLRPLLTEVSHVAWRGAPLEMTGWIKGGAQRAHTLKAWVRRGDSPVTATPFYHLQSTKQMYCFLSLNKKTNFLSLSDYTYHISQLTTNRFL
jgi:hypothetical protein